jgi:hypothetical protein
VKVQVGIDVIPIELVDRLRMARLDVSILHVLSHHRSVFALGQSIVIAMPRPRLRLFRQQFVQQLGHPVVDILASVVGMKAPDAKRKLLQHRFQHRQQSPLADLPRRPYPLPLRHLIHGIEVIHAFTSGLVSLVDCVHAQVS